MTTPTIRVTVRSRRPRGTACGGRLWTSQPVTLDVDATTVRDLWNHRADLEITWPPDWVAPDGSRPGYREPEPEPEIAPDPPLDESLTLLHDTLVGDAAPEEAQAARTEPAAAVVGVLPTPGPAISAPNPASLPPAPPLRLPPPVIRPAPLPPPEVSAGAAALFKLALGKVQALPTVAKVAIPPDLGPDFQLEHLVTDPELVGFSASPAQRALLRLADGYAANDLLRPERLMFHFGTTQAPAKRPTVVIPRAGVRSGKSLLAALCGLAGSLLRCRFRRPPKLEEGEIPDPRDGLVGVRPGELVRALVVTPLVRQSRATFRHFTSNIQQSPRLKQYLVHATKEQAVFRRPDGNEVLIEMVAASAAGDNLRSTWLAGVVFDEADFFDDEDGAISLTENLRAATSRLLDGAQVWLPSSPWAESGPYYELFTEAWAKAGDTLAFHSDTRSMNPTFSRELEAKERARDPDNATREYDAIPLAINTKQWFPPEVIAKAIDAERPLLLPPAWGHDHYAGGDLGFRKNSSALAIARAEDARVVLAYYEELRPLKGEPLKPSEVCKGFGLKLVEYGATSVRGDIHYADTAKEEFGRLAETAKDELLELNKPGATVEYDEWHPSIENVSLLFQRFRELMAEGRLSLPNDARLLKQLKGVRSKPMPGNKMQVVLPKQGRAHGDLLLAVVLACVQAADAAGRAFAPYDERYDRMLPATDDSPFGGRGD